MGFNKQEKIICALLLLSAIAFVAVFSVDNQTNNTGTSLLGSQQSGLIIDLNCTLPTSIPNQIPSLKVSTRPINNEIVLEIASNKPFYIGTQLEVRNYTWINGTTEFYVVPIGTTTIDGSTTLLRLFPEGQVQYYAPGWTGYTTAPKLPSKEDAKIIADDFLSQIKQSKTFIPTLPIEITFKDVVSGMETTANDTHWIDYWCVIYELKYNNLPIGGNSDVRVWIGDKGEIVGLVANWRDLKASNPVTIGITPEEALDQLGNHLKIMTVVTKIAVQNVSFGYWADKTVLENTEYIMPAYIFDCVVTLLDGSQQRMFVYVPAYK